MSSEASERQYELVYIVTPVATDAEVEALQSEIDGHVVALGGTVDNTDLWGRRKLAYQIGDYGEGIYICQLISGPGEMVSELERRLRVRDQVLRHLTVRVDEDLRKARRLKEKRKATVDRRRAARGLPPLPVAEAVSAPAVTDTPAGATASPEPVVADAAPAAAPVEAAPAEAAPVADATPDAPAATSEPAEVATETEATPPAEAETATPSADAASTDAPAETPEVKE